MIRPSHDSTDRGAFHGARYDVRCTSDDALMTGLKAGDASALASLMERYWFPIVRFVARSGDGWDEAEDTAQEVFVRLWRDRATWRSGGSVRAYLYQVARNLIVDRARRAEVRTRSTDEARRVVGRVATPVEEAMRGELRADFEAALAALPERRRQAFVLVRLEGLTLKEAAEVMDLTPRTIANHVYLAATDLADALREHIS